ncbi:MAG: hypothetical protein HY937_03170 [Nitrosomonadales bacterium]|nr:hypothetical protein [Nitrosomonadales bacterium]
MHQQFSISAEESKRAKWPHEIFLINLVFNHIFVFVATTAVVGTLPLLPALVPVISFSIIGYIIFKARQVAASDETWFVKSHWRIGARHNRIFMLLLAATCLVSGGGLWLSRMLGWARIQTIALIGGVGLLPFMVSLLVLIVLGNDAVFQARTGKLPKRLVEQNPGPQPAADQ